MSAVAEGDLRGLRLPAVELLVLAGDLLAEVLEVLVALLGEGDEVPALIDQTALLQGVQRLLDHHLRLDVAVLADRLELAWGQPVDDVIGRTGSRLDPVHLLDRPQRHLVGVLLGLVGVLEADERLLPVHCVLFLSVCSLTGVRDLFIIPRKVIKSNITYKTLLY